MTIMDIGKVVSLPVRPAWAENEALVMPRTPDCHPWCAYHCILDNGDYTFCMGEDLPVYVHEYGGSGYLGIVGHPGEVPKLDLGLAWENIVMTVDEAEKVAQAIMRQVARARGTEEA
ncbi:hypothetical protein ACIHFD_56515 [Nonomuraea sp. NPDC051941]|uniref:hypothetical protein n=1 Tax=Nonomuraea sp. NPDC051941 TaxID=3364373 RepID=UPI0037C930C6